jgi:hypothetical protein
MSDTPEFVDLVNRLRALLDSEYRRGHDDAARRIMAVAQAEVSPSSEQQRKSVQQETLELNDNAAARQSRKSNGRRAPAGAPNALVTRVLTERGSQGASSRDIQALASSDIEKLVSQSGIRFALDRGRKEGKYRNDAYGRWFLVRQTEN